MSGSGIRSPQILIASALLALTLVVYWPTLSHDFVNYDDGDYVFGNSAIQGGLNWPNGCLGIQNRPCQQLASIDLALARVGLPAFWAQTRDGIIWPVFCSTPQIRCCFFMCCK